MCFGKCSDDDYGNEGLGATHETSTQRLISLLDPVSSESSNLTVCLQETRESCLRYLVEQKVMSCIVNTRSLVFVEMEISSVALYGLVIYPFFSCGICSVTFCVI